MDTTYYMEIENIRKELFDEIATLNDEQFNTKCSPQTWSISQICEHLYLTEILFTKAIQYGLRNESDSEAPSQSIHLISDRSIKVEAPDIAKPSEQPQSMEQIHMGFKKSRERMKALLDSIADYSVLTKKQYKHPVYQEMSLLQWFELLPIHEKRHIEQIKEIKATLESKE